MPMTSQLCGQTLGGLNEMLKICHNFAQSNSNIFNNKKIVCIKFGKEIVKNEKAMLHVDTHVLKWLDKVKHFGNLINTDCNEIMTMTMTMTMK